MKSLSINEAKKNLSQLMSDAALDHEPVHIKGDGVSAVLLARFIHQASLLSGSRDKS